MATFVLVPGFWLGASSWDAVVERLTAAGHTAVALDLPNDPGTRLAEHVDVVSDAVTSAGAPVVLVGSSMAAREVQIVTGEHPELIALAVYVDAFPTPIAESDEPEGESIPFDWTSLTLDEQRDLTEEQRTWLESTAVPYPAQTVRDGWELDARRFDVPALIVATGFDQTQWDVWRRDYPGEFTVFDQFTQVSWAWLPTSHWPHLTKPAEFTQVLLDNLPA